MKMKKSLKTRKVLDLLGLLIGGWFLISWKFAIECECIHGASFSCGQGKGAFSNRKLG